MEKLSYSELKTLLSSKSITLNDEFDIENWDSEFNETLKPYFLVLEDINKDLVYFDREYGFNENDTNLLNLLETMVVDEKDNPRLNNFSKKLKVFLLFLKN